VSERRLTPEERAAARERLRNRRYRRRRLTALVVVAAGLLGVGALLAGFVFGGSSTQSPARLGASTSTVCEPTEPPRTLKPRWWTARRQLVLLDSVLLGGVTTLKDALPRWKFGSSASRRSCSPRWRSAWRHESATRV
jgi:hypothetical protein